MFLKQTDTNTVGVTTRIKLKVNARHYKFKGQKPEKISTAKNTKEIKPKLLTKYQFEELKTLIELKSSSLVGRSNLLDLLVYEETILVRVIQKWNNIPCKYIVKIAGMTYLINLRAITIKIHDPAPFTVCTSGKRSKPSIKNEV